MSPPLAGKSIISQALKVRVLQSTAVLFFLAAGLSSGRSASVANQLNDQPLSDGTSPSVGVQVISFGLKRPHVNLSASPFFVAASSTDRRIRCPRYLSKFVSFTMPLIAARVPSTTTQSKSALIMTF